MDFGLLYDFRNPPPWAVPAARLYAETLEQIRLAEQLGYDSVWVTEHHFTDDGYLPSVDVVAGAIAAVTERVKIGHSVLLLPLHHPLEVAENGAVVDLLSDGRYIFGPGLGYKLDEFEAFGVDRRHRPSLMDESLEIITRAWGDGPFSFSGRHFQLSDINVTPKPVQRPRPPIWMAARADAPLRRAARFADGIIAVGSQELIGRYRRFVAEAGKDPDAAKVAVLRSSIVSEDPERTWAEVEGFVRWRYERYGQWYGEAADLPEDGALLDRLRDGEMPYGRRDAIVRTPDQEAAELAQLAAVGVDCVIYFATYPGWAPLAMLPTIETVIRDLAPALRPESPGRAPVQSTSMPS